VKIDSHHHLWRLSRGDYDWLTPALPSLYRDFDVEDLAPLLAQGGIDGAIVVQAAPTAAETAFLLDLAARTPALLGVVGWTDITARDAPETIARLAENLWLKGLRPMLQDLADDDFILRPDAATALAAIDHSGLRYEALIRPRHLRRIISLRERRPDLPIVVNHAAKPDIAHGAWSPWAEDLRDLAGDGTTLCKLSGLITEAGPDGSIDQMRRYTDHILACFGPSRVMWGSDWPVMLLAGDYAGWLAATQHLLSNLSPSERADVFGGTAQRFYGL
jgi:L-fuconolactonase